MVRRARRGARITILFTLLLAAAVPSWLSAAPPDPESVKEQKEQLRKQPQRPPAPTPTRPQQAPPGGTSTTRSPLTGSAPVVDRVLILSGASWATVPPNARGEYETVSLQRGVRIEFRVPVPSTIEIDIDGVMLVKDQSPGYSANITHDAGVANWVMNVVLPPAKLMASQIGIGINSKSAQGSTRSVVKLVQRQPVKPVVDKVLILSGGSFTTVSPNARGEYEVLPLQTGVRIEFHVPFPSTIGVDVDGVVLAKDQSPGYSGNITNDVTRTWWANWVMNVVPPPAKLTASQLEIGISGSTAAGPTGGASSGPPRSAIKLVAKPQAQRPPSATNLSSFWVGEGRVTNNRWESCGEAPGPNRLHLDSAEITRLRSISNVRLAGILIGLGELARPGAQRDVALMTVSDGASRGIRAGETLVEFVNEAVWAKEIYAWNSCQGKLASLVQPENGGTVVISTRLTRPAAFNEGDPGPTTLVFRKPGFLGVWVDIAHFHPETFWGLADGKVVRLLWLCTQCR